MALLFPRQTLPTAIPTSIPAGISIPTSIPTVSTGTATSAAPATSSAAGVVGTLGNIKDSFSSWDKCMSKTYCKWPVIVVIIVVSLIVLSILFCIGRCLCCGAECACCCFRCCAGCCGGGRNKKHKHLDSAPNTPYRGAPPPQAWDQQYQSQPQPAYHSPLAAAPTPFQAASAATPQFATFESTSKKVHEDALPAMPSWETAASKKVEVWEEPEAHELEKLNPHGQSTVTTFNSVQSPQPLRPGPGPPSPYSENDAFLGGGHHGASQYSLTGGQTQGVVHDPYRAGASPAYRGASPAPNIAAYGGYGQPNENGQQYGRQNVGQQQYGSSQPRGVEQSPYGQQGGYGDRQNYGRNDAYNNQPVSPLYAPSGSTAFDAPAQRNHGQSPTYGGAGAGYGRKPVNGSWRDV